MADLHNEYEPWNMDEFEIDNDYKPLVRNQVMVNEIDKRTPKDFKEAIENIKATVPKTVDIPKVEESFLLVFDANVKGKDLNTITSHIQDNFINLRETIIKQNNALGTVYDALTYIDQENIAGLRIALASAEKNSETAKILGENNKKIQIGLKKTIDVLENNHRKHEKAIENKADKDSVFTKQEMENKLEGKADKTTTLAGYGIEDAYTKTAADDAISKAIENKADKDSVYTKQETETKLEGKADKATTLAGYGIEDAYTKTAMDDAISKAIENKADKDSVFTKQETETKLEGKADKATTLAGYGIEDAFTKTEINATLETKATKSELTAVQQSIEKANVICKELTEENERKQNSLDEMNKKIIRLYFITGIAIAICILQFLFMYQRLA